MGVSRGNFNPGLWALVTFSFWSCFSPSLGLLSSLLALRINSPQSDLQILLWPISLLLVCGGSFRQMILLPGSSWLWLPGRPDTQVSPDGAVDSFRGGLFSGRQPGPGDSGRWSFQHTPWFCCGSSSRVGSRTGYRICETQRKMEMPNLLIEVAQGMPKSGKMVLVLEQTAKISGILWAGCGTEPLWKIKLNKLTIK